MTPMMTTTVDHSHPHTERVRRHKDGSVLLSIAEDRICKLNGVGALTWMILEEAATALSLDQIVQALEQQFDAINSEGEVRYDVSVEQLHADTSRFLQKMVSLNLLDVSEDSYSIKEDVCGTTSATVECNESVASVPANEELEFSRSETLLAFIGLLAFDLLLKFAGFQYLIRKVERWPTAKPFYVDLETCRRVRAAVDRAQMYYPKKAMCLQHSAVVTCLLRRHGVPAEMILAAQEFPPKAHAWVEVAGTVVNDKNSVKNEYLILRRL
jgi:Transglutaminase-like superfamily/Coenzyme PQQ synthesis protein D (PqqD)